MLHSTHAWKNAPFPIGLPWECEEGVCVVERSLGPSQRWGPWPSSGLFAALAVLFSSVSPAHAQTNNAPVFPPADANEDYTRTVDENTADENTAWFQPIGDPVTATDDTDDKLIYSLENARTSNFTIHSRTGQLQVGAPLNYEDENGRTHTVKVIATDPSGDSDSVTVTINVNNVNEDGKVSLSWKRPQVGFAVEASLKDPDGDASNVTWHWEKLSGSNWTAISDATSKTYTPVEADKNRSIRAVATYTDPLASNQGASSGRAYVQAPPDPNYDPVFRVNTDTGYDCDGYNNESADICLSIPRRSPPGDDIYYPASIDTYSENTDRDEVHYSLSGTDASLFRMDPLSRELYTTDAHAYNNPGPDGKFEITITATDPSERTADVNVALRPTGPWKSPAVKGPARITYPENGTWPLATYSATAPNLETSTSPDRTITGWIISVNPGGGEGDFFRINDEGMLLFEQPPDYEEPTDDYKNNTYSFSIMSYDTNPPDGRPGQSYFSVTVTVVDVDETVEILGPSILDYAENRTDAVHTYAVSGSNGPVTWSVSGTDGDHFSISETGTLTFLSPPDYEDPLDLDGGGEKRDQPDNGYLVAITVEDGTNIKTEHVKVRVTNVNEPPEFNEGETATREVEADAGLNTLIGDPVKATDPDEGGYLTYTVPDTLPFSISQYTGQLSVSGTIDQNRVSYEVAVIVTDNDPDDSEDDRIIVTVNVAGGGNNAPVFPAGVVSFSIYENTATVQDVGTPVTATDDDSDDDLTYSLGGTDAGFFTIVDDSGQIKTKSTVTYDYEAKSSYSVTVTADDSNGGTATKAVTITLNNVEEGGTVTLSTYQPSARAQITATVTDLDGGVTNTTWQWSKSDSQSGNYTNIGGATSANYTPPDGDVGKFLKATASYDDDQGTGRNAAATTTAAVQDGTNRPPDFGATSTTLEVAENTAAGQPVGNAVTATDADRDTLEYSLTGGDASLFELTAARAKSR